MSNHPTTYFEYAGTEENPRPLQLGSYVHPWKRYPFYQDKLLVAVNSEHARKFMSYYGQRVLKEYDPFTIEEQEACVKHFIVQNPAQCKIWIKEAEEAKANEPVSETEAAQPSGLEEIDGEAHVEVETVVVDNTPQNASVIVEIPKPAEAPKPQHSKGGRK